MREIFRLVGKIALDGTIELNEKLQAIDKRANQVSRSLNKMGKDLTKIGKEFTKSITLPVIGALGAITKFGADFQKAMTESTAIMGDVSDVMRNDMEKAARSVATTTKFSASEAAKAYFYLASAGLDAAQSIEALPRVASFAQAGNFDLARATDLLTDAQSALGLAVDDTVQNMDNMNRVSDVLVAANTLANATVEQFSEALTNKAGAALRLLNKDVEEGTAVLSVFADQGVKGAAAGESLNIVMRDLQRAAINNKEAFEQADISVYDSSGNMRNMADIVQNLEDRLAGMSDEQRRSELMMLGFQDKSVSAMMSLLGTSDAIRNYETQLRNAAGTTQQVADKQLKNFWDQLNLIKDKIIDVALTLWEELEPVMMDVIIPALEKAADKLGELVRWFGNLDPPMKETILTLIALAASYGPVLIFVGKIATGFGGLIPLIAKLVTGQLSLNAAMAANPIGMVVTAIYLLITAGILLWKNWDKVKTFMLDAWDAIVYGVQQAVSYLKGMIFSYIKMWVDGINIVVKYIPGLNSAIESAQNKLQDLIDAEKENIKYRREAREETKAQARALKEAEEEVERLKKAEEELAEAQKEQTQTTQGQIEATEELARKRAELEERYTKKVFEQSASRIEILEAEMEEELAKADEVSADKTNIRAYYETEISRIRKEEADKRIEIMHEEAEEEERRNEEAAAKIQELLERRQAFEDQWNQKQFEASADRMEILDAEMQEVLTKAEELGVSEAAIVAYYEQRKRELRQETFNEYFSTASDLLGRLDSIFGQYYQNRNAEIENWYDAEKETIENSQMNEEEKEAALKELDEERDQRKREIARKQAAAEKASALFSIAINTARAIIEALPNVVLAGVIGAMGAAQAALVAAEPLPELKTGGLAIGETAAIVGDTPRRERGELIMPMRTGVEMLTDMLIGKLSQMSIPRPDLASAGGASATYDNRTEVHLHIGTLIADKPGLKMLERKLAEIRLSENRRRGINETW